jgi:hypothetical protein
MSTQVLLSQWEYGMTTADDTPSQTPPWYPDPDDSNSEIYWNGTRFHGSRKRDSSPLDSRLQRFKRLFSNQKWAWAALIAFLPLMGTIVGGLISSHTGAEQAAEKLHAVAAKRSLRSVLQLGKRLCRDRLGRSTKMGTF